WGMFRADIPHNAPNSFVHWPQGRTTTAPGRARRTRPPTRRCREEPVMAWIVLVASGVLETVWATALEGSRSFTRPLPSAVFVVALVLSMGGLGYALRTLPVGTAYAVWVG